MIVVKKHELAMLSILLAAGILLLANLIYDRSKPMESRTIPRTIRLLSYNIHYGVGADKSLVLKEMVALIKSIDPDIIALQEVDKYWFRSRFIDQGKYIAKNIKMEYCYGPNLQIGFSQFGNCILSKFPIEYRHNVRLPSNTEPRGLMVVKIDLGGKKLTVLNTHLGLNTQERIKHIEKFVLPYLRDEGEPVVLAGDFNAGPESQEIRLIMEKAHDSAVYNEEETGYTYPAAGKRIDYIFYMGLSGILSYEVIPNALSDHYPVVIDFQI